MVAKSMAAPGNNFTVLLEFVPIDGIDECFRAFFFVEELTARQNDRAAGKLNGFVVERDRERKGKLHSLYFTAFQLYDSDIS